MCLTLKFSIPTHAFWSTFQYDHGHHSHIFVFTILPTIVPRVLTMVRKYVPEHSVHACWGHTDDQTQLKKIRTHTQLSVANELSGKVTSNSNHWFNKLPANCMKCHVECKIHYMSGPFFTRQPYCFVTFDRFLRNCQIGQSCLLLNEKCLTCPLASRKYCPNNIFAIN